MYKVVLYDAFKKKENIDVYIHPDDTISLVSKKVANAVGVSPGHIYLWVEQKIDTLLIKKEIIVLQFIRNLFKGELLLHVNSLKAACLNYFNKDVSSAFEGKTYNMITVDIAIKLLMKLNIDTIIQPLSHHYLDGEYFIYLPYSPFNNIKQDISIDRYYTSQLNHLTLVTAIGNENSQIIYALPYDQYQKTKSSNSMMYYPKVDVQVNLKNIAKLCTYLEEYDSTYSKGVDVADVSTKQYVNILYFKTKPIFSTQQSVNLSVLFDAFHVSKEIPFVKYKSSTNIYNKVLKGFLASSQDVRDFEKWYAVQNFKLQDYTYIAFKLYFTSNVYISVIINNELSCDIRYTFHIKDEKTEYDINTSIPLINSLLSFVHKTYNVEVLPVIQFIPENIRDVIYSYDIHKFVTYHVATLRTKALKSNAEKYVMAKMFPYFDVIPSDVANILRLQYKKVDEYGSSKSIQFFIIKNQKEPKTDLLEKIQSTFSLTREDALQEYEKWELQKDMNGDNNTEYFKYENFVDVKIRFNSPIDVRYVIQGCRSFQTTERISNLISHILVASSMKTKETKKDIEARTILKEETEKQTVNITEPHGDEEDLDMEDWLADLKMFEQEALEAEPDVRSSITNSSDDVIKQLTKHNDEDNVPNGKSRWKGFLKRMLDSADKDLFNYKSESGKRGYASVCAAVDRRQPVVISKEEKERIDKEYPGAYNGYVKTGSTKELYEKNYYICPKIWCPKSRVAVTPDSYKEKGDNVCPLGEEPMIFEAKSFWGLGDKAMEREHYPGFLDKYTRSDGVCLPCCFKVSPEAGNRNKQRQDLCVPKYDSTEEVVVEDQVGTEKYIKKETYFPLEVGRYGLLPKELDDFLGKKNKGSLPGGTGLMTSKTDCYLRKGVFQGSQSFVNCIISCLDNPQISNYKDFIEACKKNISIYSFVTIENGKILQLFIDKNRNIFGESTDFKEFRKWFVKQKEYVARFNLNKLVEVLKDTKTFSREVRYYKDIIREFMIYFSYKNFMQFLDNTEIEKDHRILLDICNISTEWLNMNEYNFVVIEVNTDGKVYIDCSLNRDTKQFINKKTPFIFLMKHNKYYEPIYHVVSTTNENIQSNARFKLDDKLHSMMKDMILYYYNNCSSQKQKSISMNINIFLESKGYKPKYYVIDYDFRLTGLLLANNLYIPFPMKYDIYALKGLRFIYTSDVVLFVCNEPKDVIKKIFKLLESEYGNFYSINAFLIEKGILQGVVLQNDVLVPLHLKKGTYPYQEYLDDLYIFTQENEQDNRLSFMKSIIEEQNTIKETIAKFDNEIDSDQRLEIMFLKDPKNPLPIEIKRQRMIGILQPYTRNVNKYLQSQIASLLLNKFYDARKTHIRRFVPHSDEIIFDYNDIQDGRLQEIVEKAQNPYKLFHKKLNDMFDTYLFTTEHDDEIKEDITSEFINSDSVFSQLPAKYGKIQYRKIMKDFSVLENSGDILYKLFSSASTTTQHNRITEGTLKSIIKTNIVKDYSSSSDAIEVMYDNPSFAYHLKQMKLKTPLLDQVLEIFDSIHYRPSFYELRIMARTININVVIIGRQTLKNPEGLFEVIYTKSQYYLFLLQTYNRFQYVDNFQCITRKNKDIIMTKTQLPDEVLDMINAFISKLRS